MLQLEMRILLYCYNIITCSYLFQFFRVLMDFLPVSTVSENGTANGKRTYLSFNPIHAIQREVTMQSANENNRKIQYQILIKTMYLWGIILHMRFNQTKNLPGKRFALSRWVHSFKI